MAGSRGKRRISAVMLAAVTATVAMVTIAGTALAAGTGEYANWAVTRDSGTVTVPGVGFPEGDLKSDSTTLTAPSGASSFLNADTPFGQEFGSSRNHQYLVFRTADRQSPSTTTITFDTPAPAGRWGFTLGDIDADEATVHATAADGTHLKVGELGWQGSFNYCQGSPLPSACGGKTDSDLPVWNPLTSTLVGNGPDTNGASGWFMPTKGVKKLTIVYRRLNGIPVGQLWIAAKPWEGKPDIEITKSASPHAPEPGQKLTYTVSITNHGTVTEHAANFSDDLSDVLDDAHYLNDAHATDGSLSYQRPVLKWEGEVEPGRTQTVTYSVRIDDPVRGDGIITNAIISHGNRMTCSDREARGCVAVVHIAKKRHKRRIPVVVFCRAAVGGGRDLLSC
jgi:uncharacterized repeat protein (TIGR01451 family)